MTPFALGLIKKRIATGKPFAASQLCSFASRTDVETFLRNIARFGWIERDPSCSENWIATAFGLSVTGDGR